MRSLAAYWPAIRQRVVGAGHVLLCCDVDGTLAPIAPHPASARLSWRMRALLQRLAGHPKLSLAIISGRRLADAKRLVGIPRAYYAGNHGLELNGRGLRSADPVARASRPILREVARKLGEGLRRIPGVWIEDKGLTLSVHMRQAAVQDRPRVARFLMKVVGPLRRASRVRVTAGKRTWEVRPVTPCNKGTAVERLADRVGRSREPLLIICLGDDRTDEDAFRAANRRRGVSVVIGRPIRKTAATYQVNRQVDVTRWLGKLASALDQGANFSVPCHARRE